MKIGVISKGIPVYISDDAPNEHICITGMSGSGKSTRIAEIIESAVQEEKTVIALDLAGMDYKKMEKLNYISAKTDGIGIELFEGNDGPEVIEYITDVMTHICNLKIRQVGAMRNAVQYAIENKSQFSTELDAIDKGLKLQDSGVSESVRNHLWGLVNSHCIRPSSRTLKKNMVNVVTFAELNSGTQKIAAELVLSCMWKKIQRGKSENVMLIIDEFGNSLHNKLAEKIIRFFMENAKDSQIFITSHDTNLVSNSVFRPDQIDLVTFQNISGSKVTRVSKFKPREAQNLEKMYLGGMFEGLPTYEEI